MAGTGSQRAFGGSACLGCWGDCKSSCRQNPFLYHGKPMENQTCRPAIVVPVVSCGNPIVVTALSGSYFGSWPYDSQWLQRGSSTHSAVSGRIGWFGCKGFISVSDSVWMAFTKSLPVLSFSQCLVQTLCRTGRIGVVNQQGEMSKDTMEMPPPKEFHALHAFNAPEELFSMSVEERRAAIKTLCPPRKVGSWCLDFANWWL